MKSRLLITFFLFLTKIALFGQSARFPFSGAIEYEKKTNIHALVKKNFGISEYTDNYIKTKPQFKVMKSMLTFSGNKMRFDPEKEADHTDDLFEMPEADQLNTRFTDLGSQTYASEKIVLDDIFLVNDSVRKISWKLTAEMRTIAGYECRRANAIVMDSVYVVAYYTCQIPVFGGPESFSGLPGMILGLALPRQHTTWFATKVTDRDINPATIKPPAKGKPANEALVKEVVNKALVDDRWGQLQRVLRAVLL